MGVKYLLLLVGIFQPIFSQDDVNILKRDFFYQNKRDSSSSLRIVGGQDATPHQFPFEVGLYIDYQLKNAFCGGSLISSNYVLTAAHCLEGAISLDVILGAQNISDDSESNRQRQVTSAYVIHPDWDSTTYTSDIGLVKLNTPAQINDYVQTITLASGSDSYAGQQGTVLGWGKTYDDQTTVTDILQYVSNPIFSNDECKAQNPSYNGIITDVHLCLSGVGNKGFCQGDSGGPLVVNDVQVGVVSFSYKSCQASMPSVFARVTKFTDWIKENSDIN
ncbi:brachyurin-like [Sitophilus oryzae]|uniref:Brachyurin-like n=1 Tax=Sitophilus oryzae TaxID=7048 RepID=A0A6J2YWD3_SITOR|nr:brachyurin-like [Sitophilus oryzae]